MTAPALVGRGRPAGCADAPPPPARPPALAAAPRPATRPVAVLALLSAAALLGGWSWLWHGGTSAPALLLVLGHCVLVPWTLAAAVRRPIGGLAPAPRAATLRLPQAAPSPAHAPYALAALVSLAVLALYVATLAPTTAMWDASEYIAAARVLGLPHPPGNPLFVLVAHVAGLVPLPVPYAVRINLLAAVTSAASAGLWFLVADRVLQAVVPERAARRVAAAASALLGATAFTVWNQSVVNEKVYTVALLGLALASWLVLRWMDDAARLDEAADEGARTAVAGRADRRLVLLAYVTGLAYAVHPAGFLGAPAAALAVLARRPRTLLRGRLLLAATAALLLGLAPFAFEPIRAAHHPPINEGVPTACTAGPTLACTFSGETARKLWANIRREQYGGHPVLERQAPFAAQLQMAWLYFRWQWWRDADGRAPAGQQALAVAVAAFGLLGAAVHRRRDPATWWYVAPLALSLTVLLVFYLNFRYGWSQAPALGDTVPREVRDRDYFFVWTYAVWGVWAGVGLAACWRAVARRLAGGVRGDAHATAVPTRAWLLAAPVLALALVPLVANARDASRAGQRFTREWALDLLRSVEPYAVLVTMGDNDSFPLWYAQQVEGVRRDVTVALVPYLGIPDYLRAVARSRPEPYDAARGPAAFRGQAWPRPTGPLLPLPDAELAAIPDYVQLPTPQRFEHGAIAAEVPAGILTRDQLAVLHIVRASLPARPVYFTLGDYGRQLGFAPYLRQQGLVQRLEATPLAPAPGLVAVGGVLLDVARTRALWDSTYTAPGALLAEGRWVDRASSSIPLAYAVTADWLARGLAVQGDSAAAARLFGQADAIARAGGLVPDR